MRILLVLSERIDRATAVLGRGVAWLVLAAVLISVANALIRKFVGTGSNAWLEIQWWLYGALFLLAAPWALARNEHIRIDILNSRFPGPMRHAVELGGHLFFLLPVSAVLALLSWPFFVNALPRAADVRTHLAAFDLWHLAGWLGGFLRLGEQSPNAGGLPLWPVKGLIPLAFTLLFVQGLSEVIKRVAIIKGMRPEAGKGGSYHAAAVDMPERREDG